jgi:hypothetical protein
MGHRRKAPFGGLFFCPNCELPPASPGILGSFPPPYGKSDVFSREVRENPEFLELLAARAARAGLP